MSAGIMRKKLSIWVKRQDPIAIEGAMYVLFGLVISLLGINFPLLSELVENTFDAATIHSFVKVNDDLQYLPTLVVLMLLPYPLLLILCCFHIWKLMNKTQLLLGQGKLWVLVGYAFFGVATAIFMIYFSIFGVDSLTSVGVRKRMFWAFFSSNRLTAGLFYSMFFWGSYMFCALSFFYLVSAVRACRR